MTPDTSAYMIAGFSVILVGILIYVISLIVRTRTVTQQITMLEKDEE